MALTEIDDEKKTDSQKIEELKDSASGDVDMGAKLANDSEDGDELLKKEDAEKKELADKEAAKKEETKDKEKLSS